MTQHLRLKIALSLITIAVLSFGGGVLAASSYIGDYVKAEANR